jgi:hypothetical protein
MAAHMYMNQHPAHRSYNIPSGHHHHHHMDPCLNAAAAAVAGGGSGGGPQFLTDHQPGAYCAAISRGTTGYSNAPAMYGQGPGLASSESLRQITPTMMVTHLNTQALAVQYGRYVASTL